MGEEFHAMIVINGHELIVLLLRDFMTDALTVDNGCHTVFGLAFVILLNLSLLILYWLHLDVINHDLPAMSSFTEPCLVLLHFIEGCSIYMSDRAVFLFRLNLHGIQRLSIDDLLLKFRLSCIELCLNLREKLDVDLFLGVEHVQ